MAREEERRPRAPRLDSPLVNRRSLRPSYDSDTFGKLSERIARFIGSWRFIAYMTVFILGWVACPDTYPFIFLTLLLSLQASYAAPLILLAQNRQADRDRVTIADDRARTERLMAETEFLSREIAALRVALGEVATRDFIRDLEERAAAVAEEIETDEQR